MTTRTVSLAGFGATLVATVLVLAAARAEDAAESFPELELATVHASPGKLYRLPIPWGYATRPNEPDLTVSRLFGPDLDATRDEHGKPRGFAVHGAWLHPVSGPPTVAVVEEELHRYDPGATREGTATLHLRRRPDVPVVEVRMVAPDGRHLVSLATRCGSVDLRLVLIGQPAVGRTCRLLRAAFLEVEPLDPLATAKDPALVEALFGSWRTSSGSSWTNSGNGAITSVVSNDSMTLARSGVFSSDSSVFTTSSERAASGATSSTSADFRDATAVGWFRVEGTTLRTFDPRAGEIATRELTSVHGDVLKTGGELWSRVKKK